MLFQIQLVLCPGVGSSPHTLLLPPHLCTHPSLNPCFLRLSWACPWLLIFWILATHQVHFGPHLQCEYVLDSLIPGGRPSNQLKLYLEHSVCFLKPVNNTKLYISHLVSPTRMQDSRLKCLYVPRALNAVDIQQLLRKVFFNEKEFGKHPIII